ncbi:hybrid sensor histidine kinase/response regulator [Silanimonas lenta]|uniref:hybrid sensor histidine kinase/response regulator n=1 Tax=Silanimonas lenta TaxID=265429 RepID=UPI000417F3F2|nr:ATP-binding protein [Silanimonas lenta]
MDWRGRLLVLLEFTLLACIANSLALQLPGSTPFLVGNMAGVAVALRFGFAPSLPVALAATAITAEPAWCGLAVLECLLVARQRQARLGLFARWWRVWLPLLPVALWATIPPAGPEPLAWGLGLAVVLATGATSLAGAMLLARVTRSRRQRAGQSLDQQLSVQLATLMAAPATFLVCGLLQWGHQLDLRQSALLLEGRAMQLSALVVAELEAHRDAVAQAALHLPALGEEASLRGLLETHPAFLSLLVADGQGTVQLALRAGEVPRRGGGNVADRRYFRDTLIARAPTVSPVFRGRGLGNDIIVAVAAPRFDGEGRFAGVLQGAISPNHLARRYRLLLDGDGLHHLVIDSDGQVALSSLPTVLPLSDFGNALDGALGSQVQPWWAQRLLPAPKLRFGSDGRSLGVMHEDSSLHWRSVVLQPLSPLELRQSLRSLAAALSVLSLILGLQWITRTFARRHTRDLVHIVDRLHRLGVEPVSDSSSSQSPAMGSRELASLLADIERTEARLAELHEALRAAAEEQSALNRVLEGRVAERTEELRQALARAEGLARAKSAFLANMSHELRTPLAAILGYSEQALRPGTPPEEQRRCLETVLRHGQHLLEIVNDVLDASKIEAGQVRIRREPVDPRRLAAEALELLRPRAAEKGLGLRLEADVPLPAEVLADPLRLRQILLNLLSNAVKFTERGEVVLRLGGEETRGEWWAEVEDTGIGMDAAQCERVFQRFEQADDSTTRRFGGTGLGLYISRELARGMGGELSVESQPGRGSRFRLRLPVGLEGPWQLAAPAAPDTAPPAAEAPPALRGRVLVVDDVADLRRLLRLRVEATGAHVVEAGDGETALARLREGGIDLVLLDMHMPGMDGRETVRRLRAAGGRLPVYACSADVLPEDVAAFLAEGCDGALSKPVETAALHAVLARHLAAADPGAPPASPATAPPAVTAAPASGGTGPAADPLAQALAAIRARFVAGAAGERARLAEAFRQQDFDALRQQAHRLKGSAGTFGFAGVSKAAAALETAVTNPGAVTHADLTARVAALDSQLAALDCPDPASTPAPAPPQPPPRP